MKRQKLTLWVSMYSATNTMDNDSLDEAEIQLEILTTPQAVKRMYESYDPESEYLRIEKKTLYFDNIQ